MSFSANTSVGSVSLSEAVSRKNPLLGGIRFIAFDEWRLGKCAHEGKEDEDDEAAKFDSDLLKETTDIAARRVTLSEDDAITNVLYFARALVML